MVTITPWLIHVNVWQKPLQYYEVISLQLIKINEKKKEKKITYIGMAPKSKNVTEQLIKY